MTRTPEETVRAFFAAYSEGAPERFDDLVAADYQDFGHTPPGQGPEGAKDDYRQAVAKVGGNIMYSIEGVVTRGDTVAAVWTGTLPNGGTSSGLSLYLIVGGKITETRHTALDERE